MTNFCQMESNSISSLAIFVGVVVFVCLFFFFIFGDIISEKSFERMGERSKRQF